MPQSPPKLCSHPGCGRIGKHGHGPSAHERARPSAAKRGYDRRHQRWRFMVLARDPICRICEHASIVKASTDADHIVPLSRGGNWTLENGQGLCHECHSRKTAIEDGGFKGGAGSKV